MYKLDLPLDYKEAAAIERRRNQEAQRKSRIFNAKVRTIGIDKQGLEQQVHDRKQMEFMEKRRDEAFRKYNSPLSLSVLIYKCRNINMRVVAGPGHQTPPVLGLALGT